MPIASFHVLLVVLLAAIGISTCQYVYYPQSPHALYQSYMHVNLSSGNKKFYSDTPGYGSEGAYNGAYGITLDLSERFAFVTAVESKRIRKLQLSNNYVGSDITRKYRMYTFRWTND